MKPARVLLAAAVHACLINSTLTFCKIDAGTFSRRALPARQQLRGCPFPSILSFPSYGSGGWSNGSGRRMSWLYYLKFAKTARAARTKGVLWEELGKGMALQGLSRRAGTSVSMGLSSMSDDNLAKSSAEAIVLGLRARTKPGTPLDLETDFFDASTGLHSEGVWHNALIGTVSILLSAREGERGETREGLRTAARQIAESLLAHSWDGTSFKRRAHSGLWDHAALEGGSARKIEQAEYYKESSEHRCVQHGMAVIFWSLLRGGGGSEPEDNAEVEDAYQLIAASFIEQFWDSAARRWRAVSLAQGGGVQLDAANWNRKNHTQSRHNVAGRKGSAARKSTSSGRQILAETGVYYRAVDQAVGLLATLRMIRLCDARAVSPEKGSKPSQNGGIATVDRSTTAKNRGIAAVNGSVGTVNGGVSRAQLSSIASITCAELLSPSGFGYGEFAEARAYIGVERGRNLWHDGWAVLALLCARQQAWPEDDAGGGARGGRGGKEEAEGVREEGHGEEALRALVAGIAARYAYSPSSSSSSSASSAPSPSSSSSSSSSSVVEEGLTMWHWAKQAREGRDNVRYCGDNALFRAITHGLGWAPEPGVGAYERAFWQFVGELRSSEETSGGVGKSGRGAVGESGEEVGEGLASVGDVYQQVRLHPNSELAALLLWRTDLFRVEG